MQNSRGFFGFMNTDTPEIYAIFLMALVRIKTALCRQVYLFPKRNSIGKSVTSYVKTFNKKLRVPRGENIFIR